MNNHKCKVTGYLNDDEKDFITLICNRHNISQLSYVTALIRQGIWAVILANLKDVGMDKYNLQNDLKGYPMLIENTISQIVNEPKNREIIERRDKNE